MIKKGILFGAVLAAMLMLPAATFADPAVGTRSAPAVAYDGWNNRHLVVYEKQVAAADADIYGQFVSGNGVPLGEEFVVSNATGRQKKPVVAYDGPGHRFMVVWQDDRSGSGAGIYGQLVNADGTMHNTVSDANFVISAGITSGGYSDPAIAYDSVNRRFLIVSVSTGCYFTCSYAIAGKIMNADGSSYTPNAFTISFTNFDAGKANPSAAYDSLNQRYLAAWGDDVNSATTQRDIYGQLVNANGTLSGANFVIAAADATQDSPSVASYLTGTTGGYYAVWQDNRNAATTGTDIYKLELSSSGTYTAGTDTLLSGAASTQANPSIAAGSMLCKIEQCGISTCVTYCSFFAAWQDYRNSSQWDIYGANTEGTFEVDVSAGTLQTNPAVAYNSLCENFVIAYEADGTLSFKPGPLIMILSMPTGYCPDSTAPEVSSVSPANGATGVPVNSTVTAIFNEDMMPVSINASTFTLNGGVTGTVIYDAATKTATFTPSANLANNTLYTATITTGAMDLGASNSLASNYTWTFTTIADTTPPAVSSTVPAASATGVAVNAAITAVFSEAMDSSTINTGTFSVSGVTGTVGYDGASRIASFIPSTNLAYNTTYTATIIGAKDMAGNTAAPYSWSFTTGSAPDTTAPTVASKSPADGATGVLINTTVSAAFSEAMDSSTVNASTFTLSGGVSGTVAYDASTSAATFTPSAGLAPNTTYTATITTGAKDLAGNAMAAAYTWSFTTGMATSSNNPPTGPALVSPADGQTGLGTTVTFTWKKSTDPDGDVVTYQLYYCTDQSFSGCNPVAASLSTKNIYYAGFGWLGFLLIGAVFAGGIAGRKKMALLLMALLMSTGVLFSACGGGGGGGGSSDEMSYTASGLNSGATYYWKVVADDGKGGTAESAVQSFVTQ